ncbi:hypothetical protein M2272_000672 [Mycobacterium frederiksbergense]|uniref:2OG-Fe dioxygenase family protein n=1 Tax=Mycolicibacterium frederiksbergense TaxID=117567 RepID=A0ABT6KTK3_9MYCO|nr:2OG-Fe dioxygenase family protein [Mycolicibacterium frederiksbergense]MDH6194051.1 hypothetical protein [Mycolicibacterium frederiksbergense]
MTVDSTEPTTIRDRIADGIITPGHLVLTPAETMSLAGADPHAWDQFAAEWDHLAPDRHMADGGTYRLRRYSSFALDTRTSELAQLPHAPYVQSSYINPLNGGVMRQFEPCTASFCSSAVLRGLLTGLGSALTHAHGGPTWNIKLHPYRITARADADGKPAPEGRHRDGVAYIGSLLISRHQVVGGVSSVHTLTGRELASVTLRERGQLLLGDDRYTTHAVTPVTPASGYEAGFRDVLVIAFTAPEDAS